MGGFRRWSIMAVEERRGCGYRKVGGLYLVGGMMDAECDRLPLELTTCPVCGSGIHFMRSLTRVNPFRLWGNHGSECIDPLKCFACYPPDDTAYIMMVGKRYYPTTADFLQEAQRLGVSKRIPSNALPHDLKLGETVVYLAHPEAVEAWEDEDPEASKLVFAKVKTKRLGVFCAFIPRRVEKLCWQSDYTEENIKKNRQRGIDLVSVPDGDRDHAPGKEER
jgi:hypothetical protein